MSGQHDPAVWFPTVRTGSGTDVFTERLAEELRKRGVRAEITWLPHRAEFVPWSVAVPIPPTWAKVAHVNTWLHPRFLPRHMPVVATLHHSVHHADLAPYKGWRRAMYHKHWIAPIERRTMQRADRVIAVSQFAADTARETLLDCSMQVIHNGIDVEQFRPPAQRSVHQPFRLLYVGKWVPLKGVDLLAPIMRELGVGYELRYTGGQAATRDSRNMPLNMHDIGRLHRKDAMVAAMQDADALLFPSRSEGFGLVAAEAMASGLPAIATYGSSLTEVIDNGVTGILCARDDVFAFSDAVRRLAHNQALYDLMAIAARQRTVNIFSLNQMVDAYVRIYGEYRSHQEAAD